jgi:arsenite methyltransferase
MEAKNVKKIVRESYGKVAKRKTSSCCGSSPTAEEVSKAIGYSTEELSSIPDAANMGLGCGNPTAIASLKEGETILDLGAGGGLDCFLAAQKVGQSGRVIGVDMTADMIDLARDNAAKNDFTNVEFRLGEIENLPVADNTVDVIISNCVINLSPEKQRVYDEAFRVLKPGGRISISDIVLLKDLSEAIKNNEALLAGCVAGAELKNKYIELISNAGFENIEVMVNEKKLEQEIEVEAPAGAKSGEPILIVDGQQIEIENFEEIKEDVETLSESIQSVTITAVKPEK